MIVAMVFPFVFLKCKTIIPRNVANDLQRVVMSRACSLYPGPAAWRSPGYRISLVLHCDSIMLSIENTKNSLGGYESCYGREHCQESVLILRPGVFLGFCTAASSATRFQCDTVTGLTAQGCRCPCRYSSLLLHTACTSNLE